MNVVILDLTEQVKKLNLAKRHLLTRSDQTAKQWLDLAERYLALDSRANYAGALWNARRLGYVDAHLPVVVVVKSSLPELPEPEFEWQLREDM